MTEDTATRANDKAAKRPAASLLSVVSRLKSGAERAIARHHRRAASLRVHRETRQDGLADSRDPERTARVTKSVTVSAQGGDGRTRTRPFARMANRLRRLYAAHVARLHALRVYDRTRG